MHTIFSQRRFRARAPAQPGAGGESPAMEPQAGQVSIMLAAAALDGSQSRLQPGRSGCSTATLDHKKAGGAAAQDELDLAQLQQDPLVDRGTPSSGLAYMYETLEAVFFAARAAAPSRSASTPIGDKGSVKMP